MPLWKKMEVERLTEFIWEYIRPHSNPFFNINGRYSEEDDDFNMCLSVVRRAPTKSDIKKHLRGHIQIGAFPTFASKNALGDPEWMTYWSTIDIDGANSTEEEAKMARDKLLGGNVTVAEELQAGDRGWVPEGIYPHYDDVAFSLAAGNTSEPMFAPPDGYAIIRVTESEESRTISESHRVTLGDAAFAAWLEDARDTGVITYADSDDIEWAIDRIE